MSKFSWKLPVYDGLLDMADMTPWADPLPEIPRLYSDALDS